MTFGPLQMLIVGFDNTDFKGEILPELHRLRDHDVVRLVDLLIVTKSSDGAVSTMETTDLSAAETSELGALAAALIGLVDEDAPASTELPRLEEEVWFVADALPDGTTAAVAILEHRWAIPLRDAIERAGGKPLADAWLHPQDLMDIGAIAGVPT
jgi:hypothetical protein